MDERPDVIVVGGGIVGLATAYQLLLATPTLKVTVLESSHTVGTGQSSRNSGVVHAGIYYKPGSDKATWCREGKARLEEYCRERSVPFDKRGKLVVAVRDEELPRLAALVTRARANGVVVEELTGSEVTDREPNVTGIAGLWTPETAITDFQKVCDALAADIVALGGEVVVNCRVTALREHAGEVSVACATGPARSARTVVVCAGLQADRMARASGAVTRNRIVPFRGSWLIVDPALRDVVTSNIYPVPVEGLPFLGVHLTPRLDGEIWVGPNALLALARHGARPWSVSPRDLSNSLAFPGLWRLAAQQYGTAAGEFVRDRFLGMMAREVRRYVPSITKKDLRRGPWGVRAQELRPDGSLVEDFSLSVSPRILHVRNAPSPAATASLAIGAELQRRLMDML